MKEKLREMVEAKVRYGVERQKNLEVEYPIMFAFTEYDFQTFIENGDWMKRKRRNELAKEANLLLTEMVHGKFMVERDLYEKKDAVDILVKFGWKVVSEVSLRVTNPGTGHTWDQPFAVVEN